MPSSPGLTAGALLCKEENMDRAISLAIGAVVLIILILLLLRLV